MRPITASGGFISAISRGIVASGGIGFRLKSQRRTFRESGPEVHLKNRLGKADRIGSRGLIARVFRQGQRASDDLITLLVLANSAGRSRLAVTVSRRHGNAVRRSRIKRLCREAFRSCRADLPCPYDYVINARIGAELSVSRIRQSIRKLAGKIIQDAP